MTNDIVDDEIVYHKERSAKATNYIALAILWIGLVYTVIGSAWGDVRHIIALALLIIATASMYFKYEIGAKITLGAIFIGVLNHVDFLPVKYVISLGIGVIEIGFEIVLLLIGIVHFGTNKQVLTVFLNELTGRKNSQEEIESGKRRSINGFKRRFSNKGVDELKTIALNEKLVPEARTAAQELVDEKNQ